ncbi:DUF5007 domain-containing protein [Aestuariibaculum suncheonense]|uniref:DUF5007 domain-containing protein n=1 Tax=Aestuariibaculum suncheonense TaxID=1028745 RepID=A0A8J6QNC9_9FLAO|nr:DUF5007 domain-containing protein [Aestuariibaculum suncheonense]MBD0836937.1 DUF5007 domain-containing protein [Aestuariibaculum suncheonense]
MKNIFYTFLAIALIIVACQPPEVGYLSDNIHATQDTVFVPRGIFVKSAVPAIEGSTYPLHWEITGMTDSQGNPTDAFFDEYEILTWKESFNPDTDTTLALVNEKLELTKRPSIFMNSVSGEFAFTQATKFIEGDDIYKINVKVSNTKGEKQLDDFTVIKLEPFKPVEFPTEMRSRLNLVKQSNNSLTALHTSVITNDFDDEVPSVLDGTHPYITITKISEEPSLAVNVKMVITDSYDNPVHPDKIPFYPNGASYLQNYHDNSVETVSDATATTFSLPAPPFPQYARNYNGSSSYLMYYISTRDAFTVDTEAYEADYGAYDWAPFTDPDTGDIVNQAYIRWGIKINDSGTWEIKMRIPYTKLKV